MNNTSMQLFKLSEVKGSFRSFLIVFIISLTIGYSFGLYYISISSGFTGQTIEENYNGNEDNEAADIMKFKMSEKEVVSIIHGHIVSFSLIFLAIGFLLFQSSYSGKLISFLAIEPFISIIVTFSGIWLLWKGYSWMKFIVIISGTIMHLAFICSVLLIFYDLLKKRE